jgi:hypothetical protein
MAARRKVGDSEIAAPWEDAIADDLRAAKTKQCAVVEPIYTRIVLVRRDQIRGIHKWKSNEVVHSLPASSFAQGFHLR